MDSNGAVTIMIRERMIRAFCAQNIAEGANLFGGVAAFKNRIF